MIAFAVFLGDTESGNDDSRAVPLIPLLGLLALCMIWGLSIPLTKLGLQSFPPMMLTACRFVAAASFFAIFQIGRAVPSRRALPAMAILGVIGIDRGPELSGGWQIVCHVALSPAE
jgi:hypothetical protein